jgi:endonuclease/exonuclease/phosphatase family metal-dependent hydrolase
MRLRVLSLNVWALPTPVGRLVSERIALILRDLPALDCDVALFQEVWTDEARDQLRLGGPQAGFAHHWWPPGTAARNGGLLALSKLPIRNGRLRRYSLCGLPQRFTQMDYYSGKGVASFEIDVEGGPVSILNTHLHARYTRADVEDDYVGHRAAEIIELADELREIRNPIVMAGDLNLRDTSPEYRLMQQMTKLVDSAASLDLRRPTSTLQNPYRLARGAVSESRIDYVLCRSGRDRGIVPLAVRRVFDDSVQVDGRPGAYSDHAGVLADLEIGGSGLAPEPTPEEAFSLARQLLEKGRQQAELRRRSERIGSGASITVGVAAIVAARRPALSRRRFLVAALWALAGIAGASTAGLATLSERFVPEELALYDSILALLARIEADPSVASSGRRGAPGSLR